MGVSTPSGQTAGPGQRGQGRTHIADGPGLAHVPSSATLLTPSLHSFISPPPAPSPHSPPTPPSPGPSPPTPVSKIQSLPCRLSHLESSPSQLPRFSLFSPCFLPCVRLCPSVMGMPRGTEFSSRGCVRDLASINSGSVVVDGWAAGGLRAPMCGRGSEFNPLIKIKDPDLGSWRCYDP